MGVILWIVAKLLTGCLALPSLIHTLIDGFRFGHFRTRVNDVFYDSAYAEDVYGNTAYRSLLNALFIKHGGYHYGHKKESVSSATGKSQVNGNLTVLGEGLAGFLALLDKQHCYNSIEADGYAFDFSTMQEPSPVAWWKTLFFAVTFIAVLFATLKLWWWLLCVFVNWVHPYTCS